MRSQHEVYQEIADGTDEDRGHLIQRIRNFDWSEERKQSAIRFVMLLGLVSRIGGPKLDN